MKTKILILSLTALFFMSCNGQTKSSFDPSILGASPELTIETTKGNITIKLYEETPLHRDNFLQLASTGYYDGVIFHRVIAGFMIQTGDPDSKNPEPGKMYGSGGPEERIPAEFLADKIHKKGALAAARDGNPAKASSGSQFYIVQGNVYETSQVDQIQDMRKQGKLQDAFNIFIENPANANYLEQLQTAQMNNDQAAYMNVIAEIEPKLNDILDLDDSWKLTPEQIEAYTTIGGTPHLDNNYTVFGEVIEGLEIVDAIAATQTDGNDRPVVDVLIKRIYPAKKK